MPRGFGDSDEEMHASQLPDAVDVPARRSSISADIPAAVASYLDEASSYPAGSSSQNPGTVSANASQFNPLTGAASECSPGRW